MTCISRAARLFPNGALQLDKGVLRKIVTTIFQHHWGALLPALQATKAPVNKSRLRPGDFSQRLSLEQLACIATCAVSIDQVIRLLNDATDTGPALKFSDNAWKEAQERLKSAAEEEFFGPYPSLFALFEVPCALIKAGVKLNDNVFLRRAARILGARDFAMPGTGRMYAGGIEYTIPDVLPPNTKSLEELIPWATPPQRRWIQLLAEGHGITVTIPTELPTEEKPVQTADQPANDGTIDINPTVSKLVNGMLAGASLPPIEELLEAKDKYAAAVSQLKAVNSELAKFRTELSELRTKATTQVVVPSQPVAASGAWPSYVIETKSAAEVFGVPKNHIKTFDIQIPIIKWDGAPPASVPAIDPDYMLRPTPLLSTVYSIVTNTNIVATGETGTGKTTHFEQVAARMGFPFEVINLDSEITRMDIMGRDVLATENGVSITRFEEGIVPRAMQRPGFLVLDEFDFGRPDVMYALQRVLTGTGLTLTEDGGRFIAPHPYFRIAATGNTKGQGDETGFYQGARIQSAALLNRFGAWIKIDYMGRDEVRSLLKKRVAIADDRIVDAVSQYTVEHQRAFAERTVATPFSMRDAVHLTRAIALFEALVGNTQATKFAVEQTVLARASDTDAATLKGIADRIFA